MGSGASALTPEMEELLKTADNSQLLEIKRLINQQLEAQGTNHHNNGSSLLDLQTGIFRLIQGGAYRSFKV